MSGIENIHNHNQEPEYQDPVLIDVESRVPGLGERELFLAQFPQDLDQEEERTAYLMSGGQVRRYGETVDMKMVSFEQWLRMKGAITHSPPSEASSVA